MSWPTPSETPAKNLVSRFLGMGGTLTPMVFPQIPQGLAILNPSIIGLDDHLLMSIRAVNATDYCSLSRGLFPDREGPWLSLLNRDQQNYTSEHYLARLSPSLAIEKFGMVEMFALREPKQTRFCGLEDGRLVHWNGRIFLIGTRHDLKPEIGARIECSQIDINFAEFRANETSRTILRRPGENQTPGHEKNWAPFAERPFEFCRWHNPLQTVKADPWTGQTTTIFVRDPWPNLGELRGGSQIVSYEDGYLSVVHESHHQGNYLRQRSCCYLHRFLLWDSEGRPKQASEQFSLMNLKVEFVSGLTTLNRNVYMSFGGNDSTCFVLWIDTSNFSRILGNLSWKKF